MDLGLEGKVALIGGSSRGLGRAAAGELAAEGAAVVLCARNAEAVRETARTIAGSTGVPTLGIAADLSVAGEPERVTAEAAAALGPIDVLVTNTGGPPAGRFEEHGPDVWRGAVAQLFESVVALTRAVLPGMKARGWGRIINVTSIAVKQPVDDLILSNSVRAAVTGFARTLANEVATAGITVNNVMPGYTRTDRLEELALRVAASRGLDASDAYSAWNDEIPMRRLGEPREFAALVAFLASDRASYITGTSIAVDGGWIRTLL
ncbi:MAG: SDR family oxidoreductase [Gemmatimonadota bacterium]|jgi:3-oxoacyl-[acyl-carrier protein] reductase